MFLSVGGRGNESKVWRYAARQTAVTCYETNKKHKNKNTMKRITHTFIHIYIFKNYALYKF